MTDFLSAAIEYAELGYRVFPCAPNGKQPATRHGCLDATSDQKQIEAWWSARPDCNIAIATDGLLIVDVDPDGKPWVNTIDSTSLTRGTMTSTPRGGMHYWFSQNELELKNTAGKLAVGVDTRANGGYVLVPPSVVDGKQYRWISDLEKEQPPIPQWIIESLDVRQPLVESVGEAIAEGSRNQVLTRFGGFMRRGGLVENEILAALKAINSSRCQPPVSDKEVSKIAWSVSRFEPDFAEESVIMSHFNDDDQPESHEEPEVVFPAQCIESAPSVFREAFDYVLETSIKPQPELTLAALVALFGAAFGRKIRDDYNTRTNVMVLGLAPSGSGKEHPRQCNKKMLLHAGMELVNGPERIGSHAGIISVVSHHPVRLFQLDEIGRLLATMRDPKISHLYNVGTVLMAMYSSSNTIWTGDAYADLAKVKTIKQPHVCVYGTSVPESLYDGLSPENLTDGLVGRLLVFESRGIPSRRKPKAIGVPTRVVGTLKAWYEFQPPGGGNLASGNPVIANKTSEADERHEWYCDRVNDKHRGDDNIQSAVWARAPEKAAKLALIYAGCQASEMAPVVSIEAVNWGIELANYSTRLVLCAARNAISGSLYERNLQFVFSKIAGEISANELTRKTQRLKMRERAEIIADLLSSGAIEMTKVGGAKRPKTVYKRRRQTL